jgi:hypothetical protein
MVTVPALVLAMLVASGCGGSDDTATGAESSDTTAAATTSTVAATSSTVDLGPAQAAGPLAPLTGIPIPADLERPALAVKIDNHVRARPQMGLEQADLVFDFRAEGVTRFLAVFHSQLPDALGPVRSSRTSDFDLLWALDEPIYASSGGNATVMAGLGSIPVHALTNQTRSEYYREGGRPAPHNLYVHPNDLLALVSDGGPPEPWFQYRADGAELPAGAEAIESVTVDFTDTPTVGFEWSGEREGWLRTQDGSPHLAEGGEQLAPTNVVIMITTYGVSAADAKSPEVDSVGSGTLVVLTDGHVVVGTWRRDAPSDKPVLLDADGNEITLTAGQTWVLYPEKGQVRVGDDLY